jgi:peptide/nickel transport system substrate-binding protein
LSKDGLVWTFVLKKGIKWHDGSSLTAKDFVWTFNRAKEIKATTAAPLLQAVSDVKALDDYTLQLTTAQPALGLMDNLTNPFLQPLSQAAVEKAGDGYGRAPVGVGPFKFKEWVTGTRVVVERNPDFVWGPAFAHQGPAYIQTVELRILPEYATAIAGLEAGEVDVTSVHPEDLARIKGLGKFKIDGVVSSGCQPCTFVNTSRPPFDDIRVRQAFNYAIDRDSMLKVIGDGAVQDGPLSEVTPGYSAEVKKITFKYDPDKAKSLLKDAGYVAGSSGTLQKDGQPLKLTIKVFPSYVKIAEVLSQQLKAVGVALDIVQLEYPTLRSEAVQGNFDLAIEAYGYPVGDILYPMFFSAFIGSLNWSRVNDPKLDGLLTAYLGAGDPAQRQDLLSQAQQLIVNQAYMLFTFTQKLYLATSNRIQGSIAREYLIMPILFDAYIVQ